MAWTFVGSFLWIARYKQKADPKARLLVENVHDSLEAHAERELDLAWLVVEGRIADRASEGPKGGLQQVLAQGAMG